MGAGSAANLEPGSGPVYRAGNEFLLTPPAAARVVVLDRTTGSS